MDVRDATFEVLRRHGLTRIFGNPGTTEIPLLIGLPDDIEFVMGLHEGAVVSMATGYALASGRPQLVNLHTAPGLGNAMNALANARDLRAPLVVLVGQQDRRQLELAPFLTGRALEKMAGEYPVWSKLPVRAQDGPGAIARAYHEAVVGRGPALVVVPMATGASRTTRRRRVAPSRPCTRRASILRSSTSWSNCSPQRSHRRSSREPVPIARKAGNPRWHSPSVWRRRYGTSRSPPVPASLRITASSRAIWTGIEAPFARRCPDTTS